MKAKKDFDRVMGRGRSFDTVFRIVAALRHKNPSQVSIETGVPKTTVKRIRVAAINRGVL